MAAAPPLGMGAQAVDRNRQVVFLDGDGGLAVMLGELLMAVRTDDLEDALRRVFAHDSEVLVSLYGRC
jgi:thiamine pyrophosphate-dependent acetolactate synthase large subunit-like protein